MRLLVTGGAGYIGSIVAGRLLEAGHDVVVLDNLERGHREAVPQGAELVVADLLDRETVGRAMTTPGHCLRSAVSIERLWAEWKTHLEHDIARLRRINPVLRANPDNTTTCVKHQ